MTTSENALPEALPATGPEPAEPVLEPEAVAAPRDPAAERSEPRLD